MRQGILQPIERREFRVRYIPKVGLICIHNPPGNWGTAPSDNAYNRYKGPDRYVRGEFDMGEVTQQHSSEARILAALSHAAALIQGAGVLVGVVVYFNQRDKSHYSAFQAIQAAVYPGGRTSAYYCIMDMLGDCLYVEFYIVDTKSGSLFRCATTHLLGGDGQHGYPTDSDGGDGVVWVDWGIAIGTWETVPLPGHWAHAGEEQLAG